MNAAALLSSGKPFLSLGGVETYLVFQRDFQLPEFSAFTVFESETELANLEESFLHPTFDSAHQNGFGLLCDCLLWRAAPDYLQRLGYGADQLESISTGAVSWMRDSVGRWRARTGVSEDDCPILLAGEIGPRGDGYAIDAGQPVERQAAFEYHDAQLKCLKGAGVDIVCALTMTNTAESVGIAEAAKNLALPLIVSTTVETNGTLPDDSALGDFIWAVDKATEAYPLFFMVNCAHPTHLDPTLAKATAEGASWLERFKGLRANASTKSHAELDDSNELDAGNPRDLAHRMARLRETYGLSLLGGCCGTDAGHIDAIARSCGKPKA